MFTFQLCDFLTSDTALHARNGAAACWRDRCIALNAENARNARRSVAGGVDVALTYKEYALLCALLEADGRVLTRDTLLSTIWGYDFDGDTRTVDVHIRRLRQKLGEAGSCIETVKGIGYKIGG